MNKKILFFFTQFCFLKHTVFGEKTFSEIHQEINETMPRIQKMKTYFAENQSENEYKSKKKIFEKEILLSSLELMESAIDIIKLNVRCLEAEGIRSLEEGIRSLEEESIMSLETNTSFQLSRDKKIIQLNIESIQYFLNRFLKRKNFIFGKEPQD